jgi:hypothetical protein
MVVSTNKNAQRKMLDENAEEEKIYKHQPFIQDHIIQPIMHMKCSPYPQEDIPTRFVHLLLFWTSKNISEVMSIYLRSYP